MNESVMRYVFNILISVIGFFMVYYFTKTNTTLANISTELVNVRIDLSEIRAAMLTEERVREIAQQEILKHHDKR